MVGQAFKATGPLTAPLADAMGAEPVHGLRFARSVLPLGGPAPG